MILLDTHVMLWLDQQPERLGAEARSVLKGAEARGDIFFSAATTWGVGSLLAKRKIELRRDLAAWRLSWLAVGAFELAVDRPIAVRAAALESMHGDPADRFIVATARFYRATLVTADRKILSWQGALDRLDAAA